MITIRLPYDTLPLRSNDRHHRMAKWRIEQGIKTAGFIAAGQERRGRVASPIDWPVTVTLVWEVTTNHRRDAGAGAATLNLRCLRIRFRLRINLETGPPDSAVPKPTPERKPEMPSYDTRSTTRVDHRPRSPRATGVRVTRRR